MKIKIEPTRDRLGRVTGYIVFEEYPYVGNASPIRLFANTHADWRSARADYRTRVNALKQ